jgi:putative spermidine/putrescine transport system substrate-binding protein
MGKIITKGGMAASRRQVLKGAGIGAAALAVPTVLTPRKTRAAVRITVRDPGGPFEKAFGEAFYKPFNEANKGKIEAIGVAGKHEPVAEIKAMIDTGTYTWDAAILSISAATTLMRDGDKYLAKLDIDDDPGYQEIPDHFKSPYMMGTDVFATILAYRTDVYKDAASAPTGGWKDLWEVDRIKGRRSIRKHPFDTFEEALGAAGVPMAEVYDYMRKNGTDPVFASLNKIKPHVDIWWTGGAQTSQLLSNKEVDICPTWNGRAQAAIDGGAPVAISWTQGLYSYEGLAILQGGPNVEACREFVKFCAQGQNQANYTPHLRYGPPNPTAYKFIDEATAKMLPTAPQNLEQMVLIDNEFWAENMESGIEKFNAWVLG